MPILASLAAIACALSPFALDYLGGYRIVVLIAILGVLFGRYQKEDRSFFDALRHCIHSNRGMMFLLVWFYLAVVFAAMRGGMGTLGEWKTFGINILALFYGMYLCENQKYSRLLLLIVCPVMLLHSFLSNQYVTETGHDLREALEDMTGSLGHTDYWTMFAMLTVILLGQMMKEKLTIKLLILPFVGYFYVTILFCGFATPVALFLVGHIVLGIIHARYGKKGHLHIPLRIGFGLAIICASAWSVYKISTLEEDSRFSSIQYRFKNMLENPEGGGYEVENSRFNLAWISWDTFKRYPFIGCGGTYQNNPGSGGHQAIVDYLAIYGLFGGIPFVAFVFLCILNGYRRCKQERDWNAFSALACSVMFLLVGIVNPGWYGDPMTVLLIYAQPFKRSYPFRPQPSQTVTVLGHNPAGAYPLRYSPYGPPFSDGRGH
jgi:O-antigen ligase